jgi:Mor family transcriptional regulator
MNEIKEVLNDMEGVELDDLKTKYELSVKMLFALIESVEESVSEKQQSKIFNMYNSLISNE